MKTLPFLITANVLLITPPSTKSVRTSNDAIRKYIKKTVVINEDGKQCVKTNLNFRKTDDGMVIGFAPIFPDICYHLTHYRPAAADIPV
ncbi:hypothetical protein, partial [Escherichia coli]|uniref:hypothetical protein n=4 Tax=Escherichia coli TaxID=562 RepID=UPI000D0A93E6